MTQKPPLPRLKKPVPAILAAIGATIVVSAAGALATYWVVSRQQAGIASLPVGADIIPQDALMTVTVSTNPDQWRTLRQYGTADTQAMLDAKLAEWRDRLLTRYGYSYQQDIQPWVGKEITLALFYTPPQVPVADPKPQESTSDQSSSIVLVLPIADVTRVQRVLVESQSSGTRQWTVREYKGVQVRETLVNGESLTAAVLGSHLLVLAPDAERLEQVIDTYRGEDSVADTPGYQLAMQQVNRGEAFLKGYWNVAKGKTVIAATSINAVPAWVFSLWQQNQGAVVAVDLRANGIQIRGMNWLAGNSDRRYEVKNDTTYIPDLLPEDTLLLISAGNLQQLWQNYNQVPSADPKSLGNPANLRQGIQGTTGLDLEQDLLAWMNQESAIALIPTTEPGSTRQTAGMILLTRASDRTLAETTLKQLDQVMVDRYQFQVSQATLEGQPVVNWVSPFRALTVTHGWLTNTKGIAFLSMGAPVATTLIPKPDLPLADRDRFRQATASNLEVNNGQFFIDLERLNKPGTPIPMPQLPSQGKTILQTMRAIGVTAAIHSDRSTRYDINVLLPKTNNSRSLPSPKP